MIPKQINNTETFYAKNQKEWRKWLEGNHATKPSVWLVCYKKKTNKPTLSWTEAVEEALCFGWIDSIKKTIDEDAYIQFFGPRKPKGTWSKINKEKIEKLIAEGKMMSAGYESIERAKQNGSWHILTDVEELIIPEDLLKAFKTKKGSKEHFLSLSKSVQKYNLMWLTMAKLPATREKRIKVIVDLVD
ncbi:MAG: hypothetical protein RLZZ546_2862 [Bacteroidota bacterium]|jgi:uncharacterized protein YdeI (YjbR/CyaY-like superfamily)